MVWIMKKTFAPVAKMSTIRTLIVVASVRQWHISQLDVKNAFLNGDLKEEVYMVPPPGVSHNPSAVCFTSSPHDSALFVKSSPHSCILLSLYVDDMIITEDDVVGITNLKLQLAKQFEMKDLGTLRYFLGIEYIATILAQARLSDTQAVDTPVKLNTRYNSSDGVPLEDHTLYHTLVGSLVYLTITRPDIAYAVHVVSQFVSSPTIVHWAAVLRILRYLRGTQFQSLLFPSSSSLELRAYSDADWDGSPSDRKSTTDFCIFLVDSLISWKSKKQDVVSRFFTEAEYRASGIHHCRNCLGALAT
ncbi:uncharacterized mitochondrial protein AtMg00810-like [Lotus japonicus]|uniref:uncharacterized mitochondrial protein AtMg00810-like n=1 Tax=Lotus japonicus TaxID=34305 RepID=UPI00258F5BAC|nr:uncharacterized mitochondrial protein AtMg00810-like [Lotus japonicus]